MTRTKNKSSLLMFLLLLLYFDVYITRQKCVHKSHARACSHTLEE